MNEETNEQSEEMVEISLSDYIYSTRSENILLGEYDETALFNFIEDLNKSIGTPRRTVYISSTGGYLDWVNIIIDALERGECELVATNRIYSAAFLTFFGTDVERRILPGTVGMFHYPFIARAKLHPDNTFDRGNSELAKLESTMKIPYEEYFRELLGIDKQKHKELLKGGELIYKYKDLKKLLKKSKKLLAKYKK